MQDTSDNSEIVDEIPADLITPPDMPTSIQGLTPITDGIAMTALGLKITSHKIEGNDFLRLFNSVIALSRASNWLIGDALNLAERKWGNKHSGSKYDEASQRTGLSVGTLKNIAVVCRNIPIEQRRDDLSFSHHLDVCGTADTDEEREQLLNEAKLRKLSAKQFRKHLRQVKAEKLNMNDYENGTSKLDCSFNTINIPEKDDPPESPLCAEMTRISAWISQFDLLKLKPNEHQEMAHDLVHVIRDGYALLQLIREENPETEFDLPFDIQFIDKAPSFISPSSRPTPDHDDT